MKAHDIVNKLLETDAFSSTDQEVNWLLNRAPAKERNWLRRLIDGDLRESQYVAAYLGHNGSVGDGRGLTVGSFIAYQLKGSARGYAGKYATALVNACIRRVDAGLAFEGTSRGGKTAYYPVAQAAIDTIYKQTQ